VPLPESWEPLLAGSSEPQLSSLLEVSAKILQRLDSVLACLLDQKSLALATLDLLTRQGQEEEEDS